MADNGEQKDADIKLANMRTVDALQRVYAMVIALALITAVTLLIEVIGVIKSSKGAQAEFVPTALMFIAFLSTLVSFYHGMNRHLDDTFVIGDQTSPHRLPLLVDIFVFLVEAGLLVVMANTINSPKTFLYAWSVLLAIDIVWGLFVYLLVKRVAPARWVANNFAFLALAWICWLFFFPQNVILIAVVEVLRSVIDYWLNWHFYFPKREQRTFVNLQS